MFYFVTMPTVAFLNSDSGFSAAKKRKRMPGTNARTKKEMKQCNWVYARGPDTLTRAGYNAISIMNSAVQHANTVYASYQWIKMQFPSAGVGYEQAIGRKIFAKYARFKGYIQVTGFNPAQINWRMYLMRTQDAELPDTSEGKNELLWNNWEPYDNATPSVSQRFLACKHNFYKSVRNVEATKNIDLKVIASGCIPRMDHGGSRVGIAVGDTAFTQTTYNSTCQPYIYGTNPAAVVNGPFMGCYPLDVKVKLNDNIPYGSVDYWIMIAVDNPLSRTLQADGTNLWSDSSDHASAIFNFFARLYFYDD